MGVKFLNQKEIIWKRKGLLWHNFARNNIRLLVLCITAGLSIAMQGLRQEVLQESADAYSFFFGLLKSVGEGRVRSSDKVLLYGGKSIGKDEVKRMVREALASGDSIKNIQLALAKCPLVKSSHIKRNIAKGEIYVKIKERTWIGTVVGQDGSVRGIDSDGKSWDLSSYIGSIGHLVQVHNVTESEKFLELYDYLRYVELQSLLKEAKMVSGRRWNIKLRNGLVVKLPASNWHNAIKILIELDKTMHLLGDKNQIRYVDLRVQNKIFIK